MAAEEHAGAGEEQDHAGDADAGEDQRAGAHRLGLGQAGGAIGGGVGQGRTETQGRRRRRPR
jgi:hypothetical protein